MRVIFLLFLPVFVQSQAYAEDHQEQQKGLVWASREELQQFLSSRESTPQARAAARNLCGPLACYYAVGLLCQPDGLSLVDMLESCGIKSSKDRSSLLSIQKTCEAYGLSTEACLVSGKQLTPSMLPAIIHVEKPYGHFFFVPYQDTQGKFAVCSSGHIDYLTASEIEDIWSGYLLMLDAPYRWSRLALSGLGLAVGLGLILLLSRARKRTGAVRPSGVMTVVLLGTYFATGCGQGGGGKETQDYPVVVFPKTTHDLGVILEKKPVNLEFRYENHGNRPLEVEVLKMSCGCGKVTAIDETVPPGALGTLTIEHTDKAYGNIHYAANTILVKTNDPQQNEVLLTVKATVVRPISIEPVSVDNLGGIERDSTPSGRFVLSQYSDGDEPVPFEIVASSKHLITELRPIATNDELFNKYEVLYRLLPPHDYGLLTESITIKSQELESPLMKQVVAEVAGDVSLSPGVLHWGMVDTSKSVVPLSVAVSIDSADEDTQLSVAKSTPPYIQTEIERIGTHEWKFTARLDIDQLEKDSTYRETLFLKSSCLPGVSIRVPIKIYAM
ncbi:MAG: DUF1573 domain-containing protein [Candidatus Hydrogenedentales bacterium]